MAMIRYVFREDEPLRIKAAGKANPQRIGEALNAITEKAGGKLTPKAVVDTARDDKHPLHPHFEWNDAAAAESYRLDQARNLIRVIRVEDEVSEEGSTRAFLSVNSDDGVAYRPLDTVKRSSDLQLALMKQADRDLEAFQRRYRALKEVCAEIEKARGKIRQRIHKEAPQDETRIAA
jgi:hypothetical protein